MNIVRSIITSLMAGYLTAIVANENRRSTMILGLLLLRFGAAVEIAAWKLSAGMVSRSLSAPLIPCTIVGGKIKKFA
ncbi:MAG: hypothetical protein IPQ00_03280 [Chloracidobacterium sp.]|nr:hypothetical protein [Chloracidobacterium sp.]